MAYSYVIYEPDGASDIFGVPFPYLSRRHIHVSIDDSEVPFEWLTDTMIRLTPAPTSGQLVFVRRVTPKDTPETDFKDGSVLSESDLDRQVLQLLYIVQESYDRAADALSVGDGITDYDARLHRIINVAEPVEDSDAATRKFVLDLTTRAGSTAADAARAAETASNIAVAAKNQALIAADTAAQAATELVNTRALAVEARDEILLLAPVVHADAESASASRQDAQTAAQSAASSVTSTHLFMGRAETAADAAEASATSAAQSAASVGNAASVCQTAADAAAGNAGLASAYAQLSLITDYGSITNTDPEVFDYGTITL